ncbi:EAL domain-containing protein [Leptolyngbya iicbica]|uniref:EAL domain-containing protein n=2 Tax=Cyanophyceae TaxID=3028117 RepID=A0A4Q7E8E2_9CYAN|nr:EAL domain-containing protein [Leptolyngbya sp. LK]RZM78781.1 EAL domain-containing protein [Leptolyngbya sp. LK]
MANRFLSIQGATTDLSDSNQPIATPSSLRLMIVEDVQEDVELIELALNTAGIDCAIQVADSLQKCESLLQNEEFDAVLADYRLPGLHAPDVFQAVQAQKPFLPFILVTGSLGEEAAVECIKTGMTDYVLKDRLYRLPTVLGRALAEAQLKQQQRRALRQIEQQAWRESILNQIFQAIRETLISEEVLQTTVDQLQAALGVDRCIVAQPTLDGEQVIVEYVSLSSPELPSFQGLACQLCRHFAPQLKAGQQLMLTVEDTALSLIEADFLQEYGLQSALLTPLNYQQEYLGALTLHQIDSPRQWSWAERSLVQAVAEQCAIAIYQIKLYAQAQNELEQRRRIEDQLRHDAFHDGLTGLPNRALFLDRLNHARQIAHRDQTETAPHELGDFAVLFLDLDDFRIVNDSLGHDAGDFLLQVVATRLDQCLRVGDTLARTSGDEFAILLEDINSIDDVLVVVESIQAILQQPITLESQEIFISSCIGIVIDAPNYDDASQLLRDADTAMYQAKNKGRNSYQIFNWTMHTEVKQRLQLENDLRRALNKDEFVLFYQPIYRLSPQQKHRLCGFEALIRWHDPELGMRSPDSFIPIAEQTGLILPMGEWVIWQACRQWQQWIQRWPQLQQGGNISVNLSPMQFVQPDLPGQIDRIVSHTGINFRQLRIEITESALMQNETAALETLKQLKAKNIQVAMDDFGTGYSSLSYLLRFPKDVLKIDKSFISTLEQSSDSQAIVKTIMALGKNMELDIVAEGIETAAQVQFLLEQGCALGQGYWFSEPLTEVQAEQILEQHFATS